MLYFSGENYECTGCQACSAVCPTSCISIKRDDEGFDYPHADSSCINCGNCERVCPMVNNSGLFHKNSVQKSFAGRHNRDEIWQKSTSGGAFTAICNAYCTSNNVIYGAKFKDNEVIHDFVETIAEIEPFRKSKYIQSNMSASYKELKRQLSEGCNVLFSGTPCQVAGIKNYLGKTYNNLLTIDLICHGVGSPGVFGEYILYIEKKYKTKVISFSFRNKKQRFGRSIEYIVRINFENGKIIEVENDMYNAAFLQALIVRPSCTMCKFARPERVGDITIGDFKRKYEILPKSESHYNYSTIIVNTLKGQEILNKIHKSMILYNINFQDIIRTNSPLTKPSKKHKNRERFFMDIQSEKPIEIAFKQNLIKQSYKNKIWSFFSDKMRAKIKRCIK